MITMTTEMEDFWPDLDPSAARTPAGVLKAQAAALTRKTNGLLQGEVVTFFSEEEIYHRLEIIIPALDYRYALIVVHHSGTPYPVYVDSGPVPGKKSFDDERDFKSWLRTALSATATKNIVENLLAQVTA